ncbi:interleukin-1 family member 10 isoform X2 [Anolis carolinensis]|uniref:Interleukin-1 n=1 Tax=Anolis carolinensis TaxID=28377 RepID=A0A803TDM4_ANOCA|nr:PREDICTED: interleukin-1 family member 10 isoform X2 [Anolis carolinensis]|eukprot:XP_008114231.1 PREDICTED: interleukin-1 family member 10 isoform X2 [Anolis carolinensis]
MRNLVMEGEAAEMEPLRNEQCPVETEKPKLSQVTLEKDKKFFQKTWNEEIADLFINKKFRTSENKRLKPDEKKPLKPVPIGNGTNVIQVEKEPRLYSIWDISQKFLFLVNNIIIANPRNSNAPELFMEVFPNTALDPQMQPIFMAPNGRKYSLSCMKSGAGQPQLQLTEADIKTLYQKNQKALSFTFYSKTDGSPGTCSFESAAFPGWFLSTSSQANKPMGLSRRGGAQNTLFYFQRHKSGVLLM